MHEDRETVKKNIAARYANIVTKTDEEKEFKRRLICCETDIDCGRHGYYDMGNAFRTILENKLYIIVGHKKFLDYIEVRYDRKKSSVYRLINIADLYDMLAEIVGEDKMPDTAYALGSIVHLESDQAEKVYILALEKAEAKGEMVTVSYIKSAREELGLSKAQLAKKSEEAIVIDEEEEDEESENEESDEVDDAPDDVDSTDTNAVRVDAKRKAVNKRAVGKGGRASAKPKARAHFVSKSRTNANKSSKETSGKTLQEKSNELRDLLSKLGKEEDISLDIARPPLLGIVNILKARQKRKDKELNAEVEDMIVMIDSLCRKIFEAGIIPISIDVLKKRKKY